MNPPQVSGKLEGIIRRFLFLSIQYPVHDFSDGIADEGGERSSFRDKPVLNCPTSPDETSGSPEAACCFAILRAVAYCIRLAEVEEKFLRRLIIQKRVWLLTGTWVVVSVGAHIRSLHVKTQSAEEVAEPGPEFRLREQTLLNSGLDCYDGTDKTSREQAFDGSIGTGNQRHLTQRLLLERQDQCPIKIEENCPVLFHVYVGYRVVCVFLLAVRFFLTLIALGFHFLSVGS